MRTIRWGQFLRSTTWHRPLTRHESLCHLDRPLILCRISGRVNLLEAEDGRRPVLRRGCYNELKPSLRCGGHMRERPWLGSVCASVLSFQQWQFRKKQRKNKQKEGKIRKLHANWMQFWRRLEFLISDQGVQRMRPERLHGSTISRGTSSKDAPETPRRGEQPTCRKCWKLRNSLSAIL